MVLCDPPFGPVQNPHLGFPAAGTATGSRAEPNLAEPSRAVPSRAERCRAAPIPSPRRPVRAAGAVQPPSVRPPVRPSLKPSPPCGSDESSSSRRSPAMEDDLFQLRQLPVVKFRRTGESSRSDEDVISGEHEIQIEGVRTELEPVELEDGAAVPKEFANPTDDTFMVEDAVEAIGFGKFQWKLSVITGLAWMADAMEMMILSILAPQLHCEWRLPSWQVALLTSVVFVGMMSSSTLWGNISDQYGRKTGLKISVLWTLYYGILSGFAPVYSWILVLRGLVGFGIGGVPQSSCT